MSSAKIQLGKDELNNLNFDILQQHKGAYHSINRLDTTS